MAQGQIWSFMASCPSCFDKDALQDKDSNKTERVMKAMLQMHKLDINALTKAVSRRITPIKGPRFVLSHINLNEVKQSITLIIML